MTTKVELLRVIRKNCISCMGGYEIEITKCTAPDCPLFDYRMGKDPRPNPNKVRMAIERTGRNGFKPLKECSSEHENQRQGVNG